MLQTDNTEFKKGLGIFDATTLVAGSVIGSGVFVVVSAMLQAPDPAKHVWGVPYPGLMLLVWVACGLITFMGALCYAELAASMPKAGGPYVYLREAFGPFWAFIYGWTLFFAIQTGLVAGLSVVFGRAAYSLFAHQSYTSVSGEVWGVRLIAVGCVIFLTFWNSFGIRMGAWIQNIFTVLKVSAILFLIALAFGHPAVSTGVSFWPQSFNKDLLIGFGVAMVGGFWSYDGWVTLAFAGEEIKDPKKTIPFSLLFGTGIVTLLYLLMSWAYIHILPVPTLQHLRDVKGIAGIAAANALIGAPGALFITVAILCSTFGAANGILLAGPRAYYAMAKDGLFFRAMGNLHPTYRTPVVALMVQGVWTCILILLPGQTFDKIFTYVEFTAFLFYALAVVALFVLRAKYPELPRTFKVPSFIPALYFILVAVFLVNTVMAQPKESAWGLFIVALGGLVYAMVYRNSKVA